MKIFRLCLCQFFLVILPFAVNGIKLTDDISRRVENTLQQIEKFIIKPANVSDNSVGPIDIKDSEGDNSIENALQGYRYLETSRELIDRYFIEPDGVEVYLSSIVPPRNLLESCDYVKKIYCDPTSPYRKIDGSCNNLKSPYLGKESTPFERFLPAMYVDGLSDPRTDSFFGLPLPGPRALSTVIHQNSGYFNEEKGLTNLATIFGIFLNHDLQNVETLNMKDCCQIQREFQSYSLNIPIYTREAYETILSMSRAVNSVCMAIYIPDKDQYFSFYTRKCMQYARSTSTPGLNCKLSSRQQRNTNTHYLDASQIYGSNLIEMSALRTGSGGLMSTFSGSKNGEFLPQDVTNKAQCVLPKPNTNNVFCFKAGDKRVNNLPPLTVLYALFVREHNRIARTLSLVNQKWNDEKLFQEARKIVIAELQYIVYNEYLPALLGNNNIADYGLNLKSTGYSNDYSDQTNPTNRNAFASVMDMTLATMSRGTFNANSGSNKISSSYLNPSIFYQNANVFDSIVEEMLKQNPQKFDRLISDELINRYQELVPGKGFDLAARIIQRSRDHGLPVYLAWLLYCGVKTPMEFSELPFHDNNAKNILSNMYVSVYDLDLVTAGVMETPLPGSKIGPTFACIIGAQFQQMKTGDRYWHEHPGVGNFSEGELAEIRNLTMAALICKNSNLTTTPRNAFLPESVTNPKVNCKDLKTLDPCVWKTTSGWSEFSLWTQCVGGVRLRFRNCLLNPEGPCTCLGSPIDLKRCLPDGKLSNIISKDTFENVENFLIKAAMSGRISQKPSLPELTAILQFALNELKKK